MAAGVPWRLAGHGWCVLAMAVGLIRAEAAGDVRTLTAIGAASTTRRALTAILDLAITIVGVPVAAALAGWVLAGRRPPVTRQALD